MHRLLIAAAAAAFLTASVAPAFADDYPPCTTHDQDHCRVVGHMGGGSHHHHGGDHHHHHHHHHKK
jgi:Spy/CpxP family protein refolding chaperone